MTSVAQRGRRERSIMNEFVDIEAFKNGEIRVKEVSIDWVDLFVEHGIRTRGDESTKKSLLRYIKSIGVGRHYLCNYRNDEYGVISTGGNEHLPLVINPQFKVLTENELLAKAFWKEVEKNAKS